MLEFEINDLPKMSNQMLRGHWRSKHGHALKWKALVDAAVRDKKPQGPLHAAVLTLTRCSSQEPDFDGLVSGFKSLVDGLVESGILKTDKVGCISQPKYLWEKAPARKGKVKIRVEEVIRD